MSHWHHELDVAAAFATHFLLCYLYTASIAHDTLVANTLVFTAVAFIVLYRTENALAEQTVALGLLRTVVDGLGLEHFTV